MTDKIPVTLEKRRWDKRATRRNDGLWHYPFSQNLFELPVKKVNKTEPIIVSMSVKSVKEARDYLMAMHGLQFNEVRSEKKIMAIAEGLGINLTIE